MFDLKGKTALVTGSTQGIGFEIAKLLANQGAKVFVCGSKSIEKCKAASEQIPGSVPVVANLLDVDDIERLYQTTGDVDILVLNASIQYKRKWNEVSMDEYDIQMDCNVKSSYLMIKNTLLLCKIKVGDESSQLEVLTNTISILNWQFTG